MCCWSSLSSSSGGVFGPLEFYAHMLFWNVPVPKSSFLPLNRLSASLCLFVLLLVPATVYVDPWHQAAFPVRLDECVRFTGERVRGFLHHCHTHVCFCVPVWPHRWSQSKCLVLNWPCSGRSCSSPGLFSTALLLLLLVLSLPQNMSDYKENRTHTFSFNLRVLTALWLMAPLRLRTIYPCGQEHVEGLQRSSCCCGPCGSSCKVMKTCW